MKATTGRGLLLVLATILTVVGCAAYVVLRLNGSDFSGLSLFLLPIIGALFTAGHVNAVTDDQNGKLDTIQQQTNGELSQAIRDGVAEVLQTHGIIPGDTADDPLPPLADTDPVSANSDADQP